MTDATAATNTTTSTVPDGVRFIDGVTAKGKFIGIEDVKEETGDEICNTSMVKLKAVVIAKKEHKLPIFMKISFEGLSIIDAKTNEVLYKHAVEHISYISRDPNDPRAFGYIFKNDKNQLQYIAIKTEKQSAEVVLTLKDLFEVVYEKKKEEKAKAKEAVEKVNEPVQEAPKQTVGTLFDIGDTPALIVSTQVAAVPASKPVAQPPLLSPPPPPNQKPPQSQPQPQLQPQISDDLLGEGMPEPKDMDIMDFLNTNFGAPQSKPVEVPQQSQQNQLTASASLDLLSINLGTSNQSQGSDKFSALNSNLSSLYSATPTFPQSPPNQFMQQPFQQTPLQIPQLNLSSSPYGQPPQMNQFSGMQPRQPPMPPQFQNQFPQPQMFPGQFSPPQQPQQQFMQQQPQLQQQFMQQPPQQQFMQQNNLW